MPAIWKDSLGYSLVRHYANLCTRMSYFKLEVVGREHLPEDGAIILAPNHCNALLDALVVAQAGHGPTAFATRADIFKNPRTAKVLRYLKMLPFSRERDGIQEVSRNYAVFDEVVECLDHDVPFCIFSEGTHRAKRSLLPLKKGIFRIAIKASRILDKPVYIIPVGLEYEEYFKYMRPARMSYGPSINVTEYIRSHPDASEGEVFSALSTSLHDRISGMITYFPDDADYDRAFARWQEKHAHRPRWWEWGLAPILLPFFLVFAVLSCPMWIASGHIIRGLKDKAWANTVRLGTKAAMLPVMLISVCIPAFCLLPWYAGVTSVLMTVVAHSFFYHFLNMYNKLLFNK